MQGIGPRLPDYTMIDSKCPGNCHVFVENHSNSVWKYTKRVIIPVKHEKQIIYKLILKVIMFAHVQCIAEFDETFFVFEVSLILKIFHYYYRFLVK